MNLSHEIIYLISSKLFKRRLACDQTSPFTSRSSFWPEVNRRTICMNCRLSLKFIPECHSSRSFTRRIIVFMDKNGNCSFLIQVSTKSMNRTIDHHHKCPTGRQLDVCNFQSSAQPLDKSIFTTPVKLECLPKLVAHRDKSSV